MAYLDCINVVSIFCSAVLSSRYLNENLNLLGKLGCLICILGSTVVIIHAPREQEIQTMDELMAKMHDSSKLQIYFHHNFKFFCSLNSFP